MDICALKKTRKSCMAAQLSMVYNGLNKKQRPKEGIGLMIYEKPTLNINKCVQIYHHKI